MVQRTGIILLAAEGVASQAIAHRVGAWRMAKAQGISEATVRRIWREHGLRPDRVLPFKVSRDPRFVEKLTDGVGLYLSPPDKALVLSVDEKSPTARSTTPKS